jgi:uncharacterized protein
MAKVGGKAGGVPIVSWPLVRLVVYAIATLAAIVAGTIVTRLLVPPEPSPWHDLALLKNVILPVAIFAMYAGLVRLMERRPADEVDFGRGLPALLFGIVVGSTIIGLAILALWKLGLAEISSRTGFAGLERELSVLMITTMIEELLFRVILFAVLEKILGSLGAILISAAAFGLAHIANPGATPFAIFALSMELGVMLALAYMLTRNVWAAVGIHAGWNFTQGFVFGVLNSGQQHPNSYFHTAFSGSDYLTGGVFGLEASVLTLALSVIVSAVLLVLILRKRRWIGPRFRLGGPQERTM